MWRRAVSDSLVEPVGLKANWSDKQRPAGDWWSAG